VTRLYDLLSDAPIHSPDGGVALPPYARVWVT